MTNEEIEKLMADRANVIAKSMNEIAAIKGSTLNDSFMTAVASNIQTVAMLLAEIAKRLPETKG